MSRSDYVLQQGLKEPHPLNVPASGRFSMSCKALCCCVFVVGAILNILLTTILLFGVENYHKADPVKLYEVFETPKYALTNELLDNTRYLILYGDHQSGIINFIEHEANLRVIEGKPVVIRQLEESVITKHLKETKHYVEMYLGQVGRGHHSWFIVLNDTETPTHEIEALQKKYPHDSIILISHKDLNIDGFVSHKFPALKVKQLKEFMQKDLNMDKKQIKQIIDQAGSKDVPQILQAYKNHQEAKVRAAEQAERLKREQQQQQQRQREEEQERKRLEEQERLAAQANQQQGEQEESLKKKKSNKKSKGKAQKSKKGKVVEPEVQMIPQPQLESVEQQVQEEPKKSKESKKQKSGKKSEKPSKNKSKKITTEVKENLKERVEQQLEKELESTKAEPEIQTEEETVVAEVQEAKESKKSRGGKSKKSKKVKEVEEEQKVEIQEKTQEPAAEQAKDQTPQINETVVAEQVKETEQVQQLKQAKKGKKGKKGSKKTKEAAKVQQVLVQVPQAIEPAVQTENVQIQETTESQAVVEIVDQQPTEQIESQI